MDTSSEPQHAGEQLRSLREQAGMTLDEVAARAGVDPQWLARIEREGTEGLLYGEIMAIARATQPPRPDWWDEGHEHDLQLGEGAYAGPLTPEQEAYWAKIRAVREEIRRHYRRGRRASA